MSGVCNSVTDHADTEHLGDFPPFSFRHVVMQPTPLCNLNCRYCYLPDRRNAEKMSEQVSAAVARSVAGSPHTVNILWHGGEPLATGVESFHALLQPFEALRKSGRVIHSLQTNGTLINDQWCDLFLSYGFNVGVSLDGDSRQNAARVSWSGSPSFAATLNGIRALRRHGLPFAVIAVVNPSNVDDPREFYNFFVSLGCSSLNVNVEEREGANRHSHDLAWSAAKRFWAQVFEAWKEAPVLRVREFHNVLAWIRALNEPATPARRGPSDLWPTVSISGDVVLISPEFMSASADERRQFIVGNVLNNTLNEIVQVASEAEYIRDFFRGQRECRRTCAYYSYCGGGQASNKYFESGSTAATETAHCRNTRQALVDAILEDLNEKEQTHAGRHLGQRPREESSRRTA